MGGPHHRWGLRNRPACGGEKEQEVACARLLRGHHTSGAPLQEAGRLHEVHERDDWSAVRGLSPPAHLCSRGFLPSSRTGALYRVEGSVFASTWTAVSRHLRMPSTCGVVPRKVQSGLGPV